MNIPSTLRAGDSWSWADSLSDYLAPTWTLTYYLRGSGSAKDGEYWTDSPVTIEASASGTDHVSSQTSAQTGVLSPGRYEWQARVSDGTQVLTVASGSVRIEPNLAGQTDIRSFWRKVLDQLEPVILGRASTDQLSMSIAGRSLQRMSWDELLKVYDRAQLEVTKEQGGSSSKYVVSPNRP